jgi:uncharacterized protein involved in tolerance to divalent cations
VIKTTADVFERLRDTIAKLHSYHVPECIQIVIEDGSTAYLEWIAASVQ